MSAFNWHIRDQNAIAEALNAAAQDSITAGAFSTFNFTGWFPQHVGYKPPEVDKGLPTVFGIVRIDDPGVVQLRPVFAGAPTRKPLLVMDVYAQGKMTQEIESAVFASAEAGLVNRQETPFNVDRGSFVPPIGEAQPSKPFPGFYGVLARVRYQTNTR